MQQFDYRDRLILFFVDLLATPCHFIRREHNETVFEHGNSRSTNDWLHCDRDRPAQARRP